MTLRLPLRLLAIAIATFFSTQLQAQKKFEKAIDLNDYIASITDTLYMLGQEWGTILAAGFQTKKFNDVIPVRQKMETFCYRKYYELSKMNPQYGSQGLIDAMKGFLDFEISMISSSFVAFEKLTPASSQETLDKQISDLTARSEDENKALKKVHEAQTAFAKKNGFTLAGSEDNN